MSKPADLIRLYESALRNLVSLVCTYENFHELVRLFKEQNPDPNPADLEDFKLSFDLQAEVFLDQYHRLLTSYQGLMSQTPQSIFERAAALHEQAVSIGNLEVKAGSYMQLAAILVATPPRHMATVNSTFERWRNVESFLSFLDQTYGYLEPLKEHDFESHIKMIANEVNAAFACDPAADFLHSLELNLDRENREVRRNEQSVSLFKAEALWALFWNLVVAGCDGIEGSTLGFTEKNRSRLNEKLLKVGVEVEANGRGIWRLKRFRSALT